MREVSKHCIGPPIAVSTLNDDDRVEGVAPWHSHLHTRQDICSILVLETGRCMQVRQVKRLQQVHESCLRPD